VPGRLWDVHSWDVPGASMGCGDAGRKRKLKVLLYECWVAQVSHLDIAQLCHCGSPRSRCATVGRPDLDVPLWVAQI
jgi:hypothetical protein